MFRENSSSPPPAPPDPGGPRLPHYRGFTITPRHNTIGRTPLNEWSVRRRDLYLTTHNTHNTNIHALGGIRTHDLSRRAAVVLHLRPRGHWDRPERNVTLHKCISTKFAWYKHMVCSLQMSSNNFPHIFHSIISIRWISTNLLVGQA